MKFADYTTAWRRDVLALRTRASQDTMSSHLRVLCTLFGNSDLAGLDNRRVQAGLTHLSGRLAPKSVKNVWSTLHNVLAQARRDGLIESLPEPQLPRIRRAPKPFYTGAEMRALIDAAPSPHKEFMAMLSETGVRVGEAQALRQPDVQRGTLSVDDSVYKGEVGSLKTDTSFRTVAISPQLERMLQALGTHPKSSFVFRTPRGTPIWQHREAGKLSKIASQAGIEWKGFHAFRRGNKTLMRELGVPDNIRMYRQGHSAKEPGVGAVYDQTVGLTQREQAEERRWVGQIATAIYGASVSDLQETLVTVLHERLEFTRREAEARVKAFMAAHPEITTPEAAIPMLFAGGTHAA